MDGTKTEIQFKDPDSYSPGDIIIPADVIDKRIEELAKEIAESYKQKKLLIVGLLKGAFFITTDLFTALHSAGLTGGVLSFVTVKSYPSGTSATQEPKITQDMDINPSGRHVLLVDDIIDTGKSLQIVEALVKSRGAASVSSCVLLDKPSRREVAYHATYVGFTIPNIWVQGRGMDTDEIGRGDKNIIKGPYMYSEHIILP